MTARMLLLLAVLCGSVCSAADHEITGRVLDAQSGQPIARARVTFHFYRRQAQPDIEIAILSEQDGSFRISNVPDGMFYLTADKSGYLPATPVPRNVASSDKTVLRLTAQVVIEGTVVDEQDVPVPNAYVRPVSESVARGRRELLPIGGDSTDETGYFRLYGLTAGRYYLAVIPSQTGMRRLKSLTYQPIFYPHADEVTGAQPFDLKPGDEQRLQVRLPAPVPSHEIRGTVFPTSQYVSLVLTSQGTDLSLPGMLETNWDAKAGTFRIPRVTPGVYLLTASAQGGETSARGSKLITMGDSDITGVRLELTEFGLDGTVRVEEGASQPRAISLQARHWNGGALVDKDGKFHVAHLPADTYRLIPQLSGPECVRSILQGGRDVRDDLVVSDEGAPAPIEIDITSHCGSVEVTLSASDTPPPANLIAVVLRRAGNELVAEQQGSLSRHPGDPLARFESEAITPGDYVVYAWPQDAPIEYADPEYMRQFESYGKAATVTEGGKVSVTLDKAIVIAAR